MLLLKLRAKQKAQDFTGAYCSIQVYRLLLKKTTHLFVFGRGFLPNFVLLSSLERTKDLLGSGAFDFEVYSRWIVVPAVNSDVTSTFRVEL